MHKRNSHRVVIYHDPNPEVFSRHIEHLSRQFRFISFDELVGIVTSKTPVNCGPTLTITIDDGHVGNYQLIDIFQKYNIRPTLFVCSSIVGTSRMFWWQCAGAKRFGIEALKRARNIE